MNVPVLLILVSGLLVVQFIWIATFSRQPTQLLKEWKNGKLAQTYFLILFVLLAELFSGFLLPFNVPGFEKGIIIIGLSFYEIGISLAVWAKLTMKDNWGYPAEHDVTRQKELVITGPFRFTRNPIYLGLLFIIVGFGLATRSYLTIICLPLFFYFKGIIQVEEQLLSNHFGKQYRDYMQRVRRFL